MSSTASNNSQYRRTRNANATTRNIGGMTSRALANRRLKQLTHFLNASFLLLVSEDSLNRNRKLN